MWNKEWYIINRLKIKTASQKWKTKFLKNRSIKEIEEKWGEEELKKIIDDVKNVRRRLKYEEISPYKKYIQLKKEIKAIISNKDILIRKEGEYSVNHENAGKIKEFIKVGTVLGKWYIQERKEFHRNRRKGYITGITVYFVNIIAIGRGYVFFENVKYRARYGLLPYNYTRKNKFTLGFTEEGRVFIKELSSSLSDEKIKEILSSPNPFISLFEYLTKTKISTSDIIQGDILLKKLQKAHKKLEMQPTTEVEIGRHRIICNDMLVGNNYVLLKTDGTLVHPEHFPKEIPAGIYIIKQQRKYYVWDFSEPPGD